MNTATNNDHPAPPSSIHLIHHSERSESDDCDDYDDYDDCSEITGPAADPCYIYSGMTMSHQHPPRNSQEKELLELKLQILKQQEKITSLASRLDERERENETLEQEKAVLVEELALANNNTNEAAESTPQRRGRGRSRTTRRQSSLTKEDNGSSNAAAAHNEHDMKRLIEANAKLVTENSSLKVIANVMRKSFRKSSDKDKQDIKSLKDEVQLLRRQEQEQAVQAQIRTDTTGIIFTAHQEAHLRETFISKSSSGRTTATTAPLDESGRTTLYELDGTDTDVASPAVKQHEDIHNRLAREWSTDGAPTGATQSKDDDFVARGNNNNQGRALPWLPRWSTRRATIAPCYRER